MSDSKISWNAPRQAHFSKALVAFAFLCIGAYAAGVSLWPATFPITVTLGASGGGSSSIPLQVNHQGVVSVNGARFNGTGKFRFALVDPDTGDYVWTNDCVGSPPYPAPTADVSLPVVNGLYVVRLGDTNLMQVIPSSVFSDNNVLLRVWFDDGTNGLVQLAPDHTLSSVPYAFSAANSLNAFYAATSPPVGSIIAWHGSLSGTPPLDSDIPPIDPSVVWIRLKGQILDYPGSPYHGMQLPNPNGENRFLRGTNGQTGIKQEATQIAVTVETSSQALFFNANGPSMSNFNTDFDEITSTTGGSRGRIPLESVSGSNQTSSGRVRPKNMSVVWIMRVK